jgi:hypothetical protein
MLIQQWFDPPDLATLSAFFFFSFDDDDFTHVAYFHSRLVRLP